MPVELRMNIHEQAATVATHWNGVVVRLIENRENAVFEMAIPDGKAALRLHRLGYQDETAVRSELWWCAALAAEGVSVPAALQTRDGNVLVRMPDGRFASAIAWVEGEALGSVGVPFDAHLSLILDRHRALGRLIASVHTVTDRLVLPADFTRPRWDIDGLVGEAPFWGRFWDHPSATPDEAKALRRIRLFLQDRLGAYAADGDFGPIHADVLRENVIVNDNSLSLIDFDDSGLGFRPYDLGTALLSNLYEPGYEGIRDALISGYAETRPVSSEIVEIFTLARTCASVGWTAPRLAPENPIHRSHIARAVMWANRIIGPGH